MKTRIFLIIGVIFLAGCSATERKTGKGLQTIPAGDPRFRYEGRIDFNDVDAPVIIWQASRINIDFEGGTLKLLFDRPTWQNYFNAQIDGTTAIVEVNEAMPPKGTTFTNLSKGRHHLVLLKRSEANAGSARFRGIEIAVRARVWAPAQVAYRLRMEFLGDSKTVGACNEDGETDQWDNRRTHNGMLSYAAFTAEAFGADHRNISVSGMGIITGYVDVKAGEMWDKLYPKATSPPADLKAWTPDIVFVNLGDNDESFTKTHNQPFPADFVDKYVSLVREIRAAYPKAHIVLLRGGMSGGMHSEYLNKAWKEVVAQLEDSDKGITHFIFKYEAKNHPRVAEDRILADELTGWLKKQEFMKSYR